MRGRLLILTTEFPPLPGGIGVVSYYLAKEAIKQGFPETVVLATKASGYKEFDEREDDLRILRAGWDALRYLKAIPLWVNLKKIINTHKPEAIIATSWLYGGSLAYLMRGNGPPYFVFAHGLEISRYQRKPFVRNWMKKVFAGGELTFAVSNYTASLLYSLNLPREKVLVIGNGVDIHRFKPMDASDVVKKMYNLNGKKVLLTVGRLIPRKGQEIVIRAIPLIKRKIPNITYLIVGEGPERKKLLKLIEELGVEAEVKLVGRVSDGLLPLYYNACDIFLMVNQVVNEVDFEGFGLVFLEAGACGKPVIASRYGGVEDAVIDGVNGVLLPEADVGKVAEAVIGLLENPEFARKLGEGGRRIALASSWEKVGEKVFTEVKRKLYG